METVPLSAGSTLYVGARLSMVMTILGPRAHHFRSRLIELAVAMKSYSNVEDFEAAIRANLPGFRKLPSFDGKVLPKKTA